MQNRSYGYFSRKSVYRLFCSLFLMACFLPGFTAAQNWVRTTEIPIASVYAVAELNGELYAATDSAIYISTNGGASWALTPVQPPSARLYVLYASRGYLYVGTSGDGVFRSADGGRSWQTVNSGLVGNAQDITGFATRGDSLYAATDGSGVCLLNLTNPTAWKPFNSGIFQFGACSIMCSGTTLVACIGSYVFTHPQGASQWSETSADTLQGRLPLTLYRHGDNVFLGTTGGIYKSDLSATGWQRADIRAQPNQDIQTFAAQGTLLFAGLNYRAEHWIWSTENQGATWTIRSHEFAYLYTLFPAKGRMWAGRTDGLWSIDMGGWTSIAERSVRAPDTPHLNQNYPNPFNPTTTIVFYLPERTNVSLKVFDAMGREVATLVGEKLPAGAHSYQWSAEGMASGIFMCRLQAGSFIETKKITLLK